MVEPGGEGQEHRRRRSREEREAPAEDLLLDEIGRHQVDLDRARPRAAQRQSDHLAQGEELLADLLGAGASPDRHVDEGVEVVDIHLELLAEEGVHVWDDRGAARQQDAGGHAAALLAPVEVDRAVDLGVQARDHVADHLGDPVGRLVARAGVDAPQGDEAVLALHALGRAEIDLEALGDLLRDGVAGHGDAAAEDPALLDEDQVRRAGADVEDHRAALEAGIVV